MIDDTYIGGKEINNMELVTYFAENSAAAIDWLTSINMDVSDVAQGAGATYPRMHRPADGSKNRRRLGTSINEKFRRTSNHYSI